MVIFFQRSATVSTHPAPLISPPNNGRKLTSGARGVVLGVRPLLGKGVLARRVHAALGGRAHLGAEAGRPARGNSLGKHCYRCLRVAMGVGIRGCLVSIGVRQSEASLVGLIMRSDHLGCGAQISASGLQESGGRGVDGRC